MRPSCLPTGSSTGTSASRPEGGGRLPPEVRRRRKRSLVGEFDVEVSTRGRVGTADKRYAEEKIARVGKLAPRPVLFARVILREEANPSLQRRAVAEGNLDVSGRIVRAQVAAPRVREAVDLLEERLRRRLEELSEHLEARRQESGVAELGEWRHGDLPTGRPDYFPRPVDERELVVHKTLADGVQTPDEAALDMRLLDYDFYLFTNAVTGEDNLLYRLPGEGFGWAQTTPTADSADRYALALSAELTPPTTMPVEQAMERLDVSGEPFVFYLDAESGRGNVLYRRYDGNYGLITPADTARAPAE